MRTLLAAALVIASAGSLAAQKPDFTGNWKLNPAKSDSLPALGAAGAASGREGRMGGRGMGPATEMFITQLTSRMTVEQKIGDQNRTLSFSLDGSESKNPGMMGRDFVTTTTWVENTLVTKGKNTFTTPMGEMTIETTEVRSLSEDAKTMTVALTTISPRGTLSRKLVYEKQ